MPRPTPVGANAAPGVRFAPGLTGSGRIAAAGMLPWHHMRTFARLRSAIRRARAAAAIFTLLSMTGVVAWAAAAATPAPARRDSARAESPPAPLIRPPRSTPGGPRSGSPPEDTALASRKRKAREEFGRGLMLEEQQAFSAAIISYTNAARNDPSLKGPSHRIGLLFMSRQQYEAAAKAFREEQRRAPDDVANSMEYALALCELGDSTRSTRMLEDLNRRVPGDADVWRSLGFVYGRHGRYDAAEKALRGAVGLRPKFAKAWRDLGVVLAARSRDREAREAYARALTLDPRDESTLINLANLESRQGAHARALALYARAEKIDSTQAYAYRGQIRELVTLDREADAGAVWKRWLAASEGDPAVRDGAVRHFIRQERTDIALGIVREAIRERPKAGEPWWLQGEVQAAAGDTRAALASYRRAHGLFGASDDKARAEAAIAALRAAAPDSLQALFEADSLAARADTTRGGR